MLNKKYFYNKKSFFTKNLTLILSLAILLLTLFIGVFIGKKLELAKYNQVKIKELVNKDASPSFAIKEDIDFNLFWKIWDKIKRDYAHESVGDDKLFYGALAGMVSGLNDPYSIFLRPQVAEEFELELSGKFEGIGAEIGIREDVLTIIAPLSDSPAEQAGLKAGDKVLAIDDYDTTGISLDHAVNLIRGEKGTDVRLLISRDGLKDAREVNITRDKIIVKSVQSKMIDDIAYIKLTQFGTDTVKELNKVIANLLLKNPKGIILDLRNNPGGFLDGAIDVAGEWVPDDIVVYERYKGQDKGFSANGKGRFAGLKTVVLINKGSASASEIVSGALQDYNVATIVGEKSFGKGSVQDYTQFRDGSSLKLTIALWLTPNKNSIDGEGVSPDVEVKFTEDDFKAGKDPQLDKALELLTQ